MTSRTIGEGTGPRDGVPRGPTPAAPEPPAATTGNGSLSRSVRIINPLGLHWRVAERFSRAAKAFVCAVRVRNGDVHADGKSPTDLILLVALPGAELLVEVDGADAPAALESLTEILASPGGEDYTL